MHNNKCIHNLVHFEMYIWKASPPILYFKFLPRKLLKKMKMDKCMPPMVSASHFIESYLFIKAEVFEII